MAKKIYKHTFKVSVMSADEDPRSFERFLRQILRIDLSPGRNVEHSQTWLERGSEEER